MKKTVVLEDGWELKKTEPVRKLDVEAFTGQSDGWISIEKMPAQVQDILLAHKLLPEEMLLGWCSETLWIGDFDWVYRCRIVSDVKQEGRFHFGGLDTFAEVYLNGRQIGSHEDFYLPLLTENCCLEKGENTLLIHFHRAKDYLDRHGWEKKWNGAVLRCKQLRKPIHDFPPEPVAWGSNYQGAVPYFTPVGVYREITFISREDTEFKENHIRVTVDESGDGRVHVSLKGTGEAGWISCEIQMDEVTAAAETWRTDKDNVKKQCIASEEWQTENDIFVSRPELWYPRGYGRQPLYQLKISLYDKNGRKTDEICRRIGFRRIETPDSFKFRINGQKVRIWGGSLDPMQGYTHCYIPERAERLFDMVENANMNTLRIWGEGIPLPDAFYEEADRRGILIWQEFFLGHGAYPDTERIRRLCLQEAEVLISRLQHHACIFMWCGGNETIMGAEYAGVPAYGSEIVLKDFPELVKQLDPERFYHPNSPWGGEWSDDPRTGDYHTYDCVWEYPYRDYPNFISEHIRTSPPVLHSLERIIRGEAWDETCTSKVKYEDRFIMPEHWLERSCIGANGQRKTGDYWEFYDADNAEDMIYRFGASYGKEIRRYGEQIRRGSREPGQKRSGGYLTCKLLDTWPKIYCSTIDYFMEGYIPYYSVARMMSPILLSFQKEECIRLWLVNDSADEIRGTVRFGLYNLASQTYLRQESREAVVKAGEAALVYDLAAWHFFPKDCVLFAVLERENGEIAARCIDYVDIERHLKFPDGSFELEICGDELVIRADSFIRCVEILGSHGSDAFGWLFSDNYFDMMPGEERKIRILGKKTEGLLSVKGHYALEEKTIRFKREKMQKKDEGKRQEE